MKWTNALQKVSLLPLQNQFFKEVPSKESYLVLQEKTKPCTGGKRGEVCRSLCAWLLGAAG